ncbi:MAG: DUF4097 family beta strand repeat-containing protein [Firmicutes bacterium]|nr:DUF4097 family beta strand repeat-containing protein [Bacillota bacterium]
MTKHMFIHELRVALAQVDPNAREEIISDINEHFTEGAAQGLSEEDICRALGQPGTIAAQVIEEMGAKAAPPPQAQEQRGQQQNHQQQQQYEYRRGNDLDMTFTGVNLVIAKLDVSNLNLVPSHDGMFRVTTRGCTNKETCTVENEGGTLRVTLKRARRFFNFGFSFDKDRVEITIYVPVQFEGEIKVDTSAGSITATDTCGDLDLDTSAGNVVVIGHRCNKAKIDTAAGNVTMRVANNFVSHVDIDTSAGNVDFEATETGRLKIDTSAGSVNARITKISGDTVLDTSAGSVTLTASEVAGNIKLDTSAGSIRAFLPKDVNCRIDARKPSVGSLHNELTGNPGSPYVLRASSSVGSIQLRPL